MRLFGARQTGFLTFDEVGVSTLFELPFAGELIDFSIEVTYSAPTAYTPITSIVSLFTDGQLKVYEGNYNGVFNPAVYTALSSGIDINVEARRLLGYADTVTPAAVAESFTVRNRYQSYAVGYNSSGYVLNEYFVDQMPYRWNSQAVFGINPAGLTSGDFSEISVNARVRYYTLFGE